MYLMHIFTPTHKPDSLGHKGFSSASDSDESDHELVIAMGHRLQPPEVPSNSPPRKRTCRVDSDNRHLDAQQQKDEQVKEIIVRNIYSTFLNLSCGNGQRSNENRILLNAMAVGMMSKEVASKRLGKAMTRVFGVSKIQQQKALKEQEKQEKHSLQVSGNLLAKRAPAAFGRFSSLQPALDKIVKHFHSGGSHLIEVDKSRPDPLTGRYKVKVAGKMVNPKCRRMLLRCTKTELIVDLKNSAFYRSLIQDLGRTINDKKLQSCICYCMKPANITECACGQCTEFRLLIETWHLQRKHWHRVQCKCEGCSSSKRQAYFLCSQKVSAFFDTVLCMKQPYAHLRLPHFPVDQTAAIPHFR